MIIGRNFAESYYEDERLYSTGDCELDELLERAFCEGYEYAQREFSKSEKDEEEKESFSSKAKKKYKRHAAAAGTLAAAGLGVYGVDKLGRSMDEGKIFEKQSEKASKLLKMADEARAKGDEKLANKLDKEFKKAYESKAKVRAIGEKLHTPVDYAKAKGAALKSAGKAAKAAMKR